MTQRYVTLVEVKELLDREKEQRELSMDQKFALAHASTFSKHTDSETAQKKAAALCELEFVSEKMAYKITDIAPKTHDEVKALFAKERGSLGKAEIDKILDIIKEQ